MEYTHLGILTSYRKHTLNDCLSQSQQNRQDKDIVFVDPPKATTSLNLPKQFLLMPQILLQYAWKVVAHKFLLYWRLFVCFEFLGERVLSADRI